MEVQEKIMLQWSLYAWFGAAQPVSQNFVKCC